MPEPQRQAGSRIVFRHLRLDPAPAVADLVAQHGAEQAFLVAKIMVEHPLVDLGAAGDAADARAGKTARGKLLQRGVKNPLAGAVGIPHDGRSGLVVFWRTGIK